MNPITLFGLSLVLAGLIFIVKAGSELQYGDYTKFDEVLCCLTGWLGFICWALAALILIYNA